MAVLKWTQPIQEKYFQSLATNHSDEMTAEIAFLIFFGHEGYTHLITKFQIPMIHFVGGATLWKN